MNTVLILTGERRVGKTLLLQTVLESGKNIHGGILSLARYDAGGEKTGIIARDIATEESWLLASTGCECTGPKIGPYTFSSQGINSAIAAIQTAARLPADLRGRHIIVDEIGPLELTRRQGFYPAFKPLFACSLPLVVVVRHSLIGEIRALAQRWNRKILDIVEVQHYADKEAEKKIRASLGIPSTPRA